MLYACLLCRLSFQPVEKSSRRPSFRNRYGEGRERYEREQEEAREKEAYLTSLESTKTYSAHVVEALRRYDDKEINLELVRALLRYICTSMGEGAILVSSLTITYVHLCTQTISPCSVKVLIRNYGPIVHVVWDTFLYIDTCSTPLLTSS